MSTGGFQVLHDGETAGRYVRSEDRAFARIGVVAAPRSPNEGLCAEKV
jgi:hypothetical protein